jgi:hypothetical protein
VQQVKGVEHFVGRSNQILPPVEMSPAVAVVGEQMPELHVSQIPLEDLLAYLKDYTPLRFSYELSSPMYVSVDLKARNVDDVMNYLSAHYPVSISTDGNTIFVRPATAKVQGQASQSFQSRPAMVSSLPARTFPNMALQPAAPVGSTGYYPSSYTQAAAQAPTSVDESWNQVRIKARLYELEKERLSLVSEHQKLEQDIKSYDIDRSDE